MLVFSAHIATSSEFLESIHSVDVGLVFGLDGFPLELEGGRNEAGLRQPDVVDEGQGAGDLELFQPELFAVVDDLAEGSARHVLVVTHLTCFHVLLLELLQKHISKSLHSIL